jgi:hypothetical protein
MIGWGYAGMFNVEVNGVLSQNHVLTVTGNCYPELGVVPLLGRLLAAAMTCPTCPSERARKLISDARTATYVILSTGSRPGGRRFKSFRPDHFHRVIHCAAVVASRICSSRRPNSDLGSSKPRSTFFIGGAAVLPGEGGGFRRWSK